MYKILAVTNKYNNAIATAIDNSFTCVDGFFDFDSFKVAIKNNSNLTEDIIILDNTAFRNNVVDCARWIKNTVSNNTKIIILYPNLKDSNIIKQFSIYNINRIVSPKFDESLIDDEEIDKIIVNELKWAINNDGKEDEKYNHNSSDISVDNETDLLLNSIESNQNIKEKINNKQNNFNDTKLRVLGFYTENDSVIRALNSTEQYTFVNILYANNETLNQYDLNNIDLIVCDRVPIDFIAYAKSIIETNLNKTIIVAGYKNNKDAKNVGAVSGVNVFTYKDNSSFIRQVSININKTSDDNILKGGCQLIGVYGVKGGVGSTTIVSTAAKEYLSTHPGKRVLALDFTTRTGDLGIKFGIEKPIPNIFECVMSFLKAKTEYINLEIIKSKVMNYIHFDKDSGVYVIPSGFGNIYKYCNYQFSASDTAYIYEYILNKLYGFFDAIFIDIDKNSTFIYDVVLKSVDKLILVSDCTLPSVFQLQIKINELKDSGFDKKFYILFNKSDISKNTRDLDNSNTVKNMVEKERIFFLPNDDYLLKEANEMGTKYKSKYKNELRKFIDAANKIGD